VSEKWATTFGRYKLLQNLGRAAWAACGMPNRRAGASMVALKVIKPGMDSAEVLARFDAERQALA